MGGRGASYYTKRYGGGQGGFGGRKGKAGKELPPAFLTHIMEEEPDMKEH